MSRKKLNKRALNSIRFKEQRKFNKKINDINDSINNIKEKGREHVSKFMQRLNEAVEKLGKNKK